MSDLIQSLTIETFREFLQAAGYRAETLTDPVAHVPLLRSATNGINFDIRMGNKSVDGDNSYTDATLVVVFNIVGDMPVASVNAWNNSRRFGRLQIDSSVPDQKFLVLCMDVIVAGGITHRHLRNQIEIWDGLVQQLVPWLRDELARLQRSEHAKAPPSVSVPETITHDLPEAVAANA